MADLRPQHTEEAVGANHPTKTDVINRAYNVEHDEDGTHGAITTTLNLTSGQIAFPATAVPSADPNTLDDYEEGTFAVTFACGTGGTITADVNFDLLSYTKIGRAVTIAGGVWVSAVNVPVGTVTLSTLPFANQAGTERSAFTSVNIRGDSLEVTAITSMIGYIAPSATDILIERFVLGDIIVNTAADVTATSYFIFNVTYFI